VNRKRFGRESKMIQSCIKRAALLVSERGDCGPRSNLVELAGKDVQARGRRIASLSHSLPLSDAERLVPTLDLSYGHLALRLPGRPRQTQNTRPMPRGCRFSRSIYLRPKDKETSQDYKHRRFESENVVCLSKRIGVEERCVRVQRADHQR
jgi:hypothetical protein